MELKEINVTGCTSLKVLGLDHSNLDMIICEDPSALVSLVSVDLSNARFDFSEGTPEKAFVDAVTAITQGKEDIVIEDPEISNVAKDAAIVADQSNIYTGNQIF